MRASLLKVWNVHRDDDEMCKYLGSGITDKVKEVLAINDALKVDVVPKKRARTPTAGPKSKVARGSGSAQGSCGEQEG